MRLCNTAADCMPLPPPDRIACLRQAHHCNSRMSLTFAVLSIGSALLAVAIAVFGS